MNLLNKTIVLLLLSACLAPAYAAVDDIDLASCTVFSDDKANGDKKDGKKGEGKDDEEPDCE